MIDCRNRSCNISGWCPVGDILWVISCGWCPVGDILWVTFCGWCPVGDTLDNILFCFKKYTPGFLKMNTENLNFAQVQSQGCCCVTSSVGRYVFPPDALFCFVLFFFTFCFCFVFWFSAFCFAFSISPWGFWRWRWLFKRWRRLRLRKQRMVRKWRW